MRFVRENREMTNLYCEDVLLMLFTDSDSEGEFLRFGNDDLSNDNGHLTITLLPVHLCCIMVPPGMARVFTKHKQVIISALCPMRMGVAGVDVVLVSIGEADDRPRLHIFFLIGRTQSATGRQYRWSQCWVKLGLCTVPCNERYHTLNILSRTINCFLDT